METKICQLHCLWIFSPILWIIFLPFQIPTSKVWENQLLHIFTSICCSYFFFIVTIVTDVYWKLTVASIHIFWWVMRLNIFSYSCLQSTNPLWWNICSYNFFFHLMYCLLILPLSFEISFYSPYINPFSGVWFANMYSQCITYLFLL